jgi:hypothetical protein
MCSSPAWSWSWHGVRSRRTEWGTKLRFVSPGRGTLALRSYFSACAGGGWGWLTSGPSSAGQANKRHIYWPGLIDTSPPNKTKLHQSSLPKNTQTLLILRGQLSPGKQTGPMGWALGVPRPLGQTIVASCSHGVCPRGMTSTGRAW